MLPLTDFGFSRVSPGRLNASMMHATRYLVRHFFFFYKKEKNMYFQRCLAITVMYSAVELNSIGMSRSTTQDTSSP